MKAFKNLTIQEKPRRTKQEYKREVYNIIRKNKKYQNDLHYEYFVVELCKGLLENVDREIINEVIKVLQKMKQKCKYETSSTES